MDRNEIIKIFAENVRAERARKRLSQETLAEKADITPEYLARIEKEKYSPSLVVIVKLAAALGVGVDKLIPTEKILL
ncbi:TPA: helix-turn-helix transcriptional regulator [Candidatus Scatousia excrementigallinarum]|uniref:Helix-turn-helix transcriptional regulator n=1 Tax=Candidatus Scatousia excrementigallinarum TaxID=2840935 RepID=A0A9D1JLP2_9BACT|nr:helix-turn-helix transcriptional regulator [Candidatus Scatousia excrementigallinarum]